MSFWIDCDNFDINNVVFEEIKVSEKGGKSIGIKYWYTDPATGRKVSKPMPLKILLSNMKTWGATVFDDAWSMNCPISDQASLLSLFESIDAKVIDFVQEKSKQLFGAVKGRAIIQEFMTKTVRNSIDKNTGDVKNSFLKVKLARFDDQWNFLVCDENQNRIFTKDSRGTPDSVIPKADCDMIVSVPSIWVISNKCGYSIKLVQMTVFPTEKRVSLYDDCVIPKRRSVKAAAATVDTDEEDNDEEDFGVRGEESERTL
jgi:hypothetical protein